MEGSESFYNWPAHIPPRIQTVTEGAEVRAAEIQTIMSDLERELLKRPRVSPLIIRAVCGTVLEHCWQQDRTLLEIFEYLDLHLPHIAYEHDGQTFRHDNGLFSVAKSGKVSAEAFTRNALRCHSGIGLLEIGDWFVSSQRPNWYVLENLKEFETFAAPLSAYRTFEPLSNSTRQRIGRCLESRTVN